MDNEYEAKILMCRECGEQQEDMGMGSECEACGAAMPTSAPGAQGTELEATEDDVAGEVE